MNARAPRSVADVALGQIAAGGHTPTAENLAGDRPFGDGEAGQFRSVNPLTAALSTYLKSKVLAGSIPAAPIVAPVGEVRSEQVADASLTVGKSPGATGLQQTARRVGAEGYDAPVVRPLKV